MSEYEDDLSGNCFRIDDELYNYDSVKALITKNAELEAKIAELEVQNMGLSTKLKCFQKLYWKALEGNTDVE